MSLIPCMNFFVYNEYKIEERSWIWLKFIQYVCMFKYSQIHTEDMFQVICCLALFVYETLLLA